MPDTQSAKSLAFAALHERSGAFVIANVFDAGTARMMAELGFEALATSSWVQAHMIGKHDGESTRAEALAHAKIIVESTDLPVSADLVNGFGDAPEDVAATIREAGAIGLSGASIEDATDHPDKPVYEFDHAVLRIEAAVEAARSLPFRFMLTARSENYMNGISDLDDTIRRLQAFEAAGADVLMAPGLPDLDAVRKVCASVNKPVNFMAGIPGRSYPVADLAAAGVKRVSLATSLYNVAMAAVRAAASEVAGRGSFDYINGQIGKGMAQFSLFPTPLGACGIAWRDGAIVATQLPGRTPAVTAVRLAQRAGASEGVPPGDVCHAITLMTALLEGEKTDLGGIVCDHSSSEAFAASVYDAVRTIPAGETMTYGAVAAQLGDKQLARKVGRALGRNPLPIIVPCHRVIGADHKLVGFSAPGGVAMKLRMLMIEGARFSDAPGLFDGISMHTDP